MSLLSRLFGGRGGNVADTHATKAQRLLAEGAYCPALWLAARDLELSHQSTSARATFDKALPNVVAITMGTAPLDKLQEIKRRLAARNMTSAEAEEVTDWVLKNFYYELILNNHKGVLDRTKESATRLTPSDLKEAKRFAAAVADDELSEPARKIKWKSVLSQENLAQLASSIRRERTAVVTMFGVSDEAGLVEACPKLQELYVIDHPDMAAAFGGIARDGLDMDFHEFRNRMERTFCDNAVQFMWMRMSTREPVA